MHLLCVDWDFFFPSPAAGGPRSQYDHLYAWPVAEDSHHTEVVWEDRLRALDAAGLPLPRCTGYEGFWERFTFSPRAILIYADSNAWAAHLWPSDLASTDKSWESVHLYDAHHDAGYRNNHASFEEWLASGDGIRCENWMLAHAWAGTALHCHFPPWRESLDWPPEEPLVEVAMSIDDGAPPDVEFDLVYLCRSGAWVPPWCDDQFEEFLRSAPLPRGIYPENQWVQPRPDVRRVMALKERLYDKATEISREL